MDNLTSIILELSNQFADNNLEYHFDGSTALYLQEKANNMNDIDIVFPYDKIAEVKGLFSNEVILEETYNEKLNLYNFSFTKRNEKVHLLFYNEEVSTFYNYHRSINLNGASIWVKGFEHFESE